MSTDWYLSASSLIVTAAKATITKDSHSNCCICYGLSLSSHWTQSQSMIFIFLISLYLVQTDAFMLVPPRAFHHTSLLGASEDPSGIFRANTGPYVPSGLTAEQYQQLKEEEAEKAKSMNFGAWGPRFKQSNRPDGDWLLQPKLWSSGFSLDADNSDESFTAKNKTIRTLQSVRNLLSKNALPFGLVVVWLHVLWSAIRVARSASTLRSSALALFTFRLSQSACILGLSAIVSPFVARWLEWSSRRRLWTTRRMTMVSASLSLLALAVWTATVVGIRLL